MPNLKPKDPRAIAALVIVQIFVGRFTMRDLSARTSDQVRGPKLLWRIWASTNLAGSATYWLVGRKRTKTPALSTVE
jgi:hypothetical protein